MEERFWPNQTPQPQELYQDLFFLSFFSFSHDLSPTSDSHMSYQGIEGNCWLQALSAWCHQCEGTLWWQGPCACEPGCGTEPVSWESLRCCRPVEEELFLKFFVHQNRRKNMNSLDQRIHTKCEELDEFAWARRPSLHEHLQVETSLFKAYSIQRPPGFALAKLSCARNHYDFTLKSLIVTLISISP